ncbi:MAG: hypothetical protein WA012_16695 [Rhodoferax sp.]
MTRPVAPGLRPGASHLWLPLTVMPMVSPIWSCVPGGVRTVIRPTG